MEIKSLAKYRNVWMAMAILCLNLVITFGLQ